MQCAAFPRLCSLAPENNFFGVQNLSGCSLKTAPHLRRVTLKCHFWSSNRSAFSFLIGRKLTVKLQGISTTAVNFQKYFAAAKTIECGLNEQYALFIPHHLKEHAFDFSMNNPWFDGVGFFAHTKQVKQFSAQFLPVTQKGLYSRHLWEEEEMIQMLVQMFGSCSLNVLCRTNLTSLYASQKTRSRPYSIPGILEKAKSLANMFM